jgi:hypothetical protein
MPMATPQALSWQSAIFNPQKLAVHQTLARRMYSLGRVKQTVKLVCPKRNGRMVRRSRNILRSEPASITNVFRRGG